MAKHDMQPAASSRRCPKATKAAILVTGPSNGAPGSPESPQGAECNRQEPTRATSGFEAGSGAGSRVCDSRGPQQQDPRRHFVAHLQWCGAVLISRAEDTDAAHTSCASSARRATRPPRAGGMFR